MKPMTILVSLQKSSEPIFPDFCVSCFQAKPGQRTRIKTHRIGWWTALLHFGDKVEIDFPICLPCRNVFERLLWTRRFISAAVILVASYLGLQFVGDFGGPIRKWVIAAAALAIAIPWFVFELLSPLAVEVTATARVTDFKFKNQQYAALFAELNGSSINKTNKSPKQESSPW